MFLFCMHCVTVILLQSFKRRISILFFPFLFTVPNSRKRRLEAILAAVLKTFHR